jgi:hypothetical protein
VLRDRGRLAAAGHPEDLGHLAQPAGPAPAGGVRELGFDDAVHDRGFSLGLDLVRHHEPALADLEQREGLVLHARRIDEPAHQLGKLEEGGGPLEEGRDRRLLSCIRSARLRLRLANHFPPAGELGRWDRAQALVERERLGHQRAGAAAVHLDPGQLLGLAEAAQLRLEPLARDGPTRRVHDARLVVQDQRAEA